MNRPGVSGDSIFLGDGVMTRRNQHYPPELRERAVRMVAEVTPNYDSQWAAINAVAQKLGVGTAETVRKWVRQAEVDAGQRPGPTTEESAGPRRATADQSPWPSVWNPTG
jgi:transposase